MDNIISKNPIPRKLNTLFTFLLIFLLFMSISLLSYGSGPDEGDSGSINRGEELFFGKVHEDGPVCASCHNTMEIDEFSWFPSVFEIGSKFRNKDIGALKKAVLQPSTTTMKKVHASAKFSDGDISDIKAYLDHVAETGLAPKKPKLIRTFLFVLLTILIVFALIDLFFTWKIKLKLIHLVVILLSLGGQIWLVSEAAMALGRSENYAPDQPIKFSHKVHVDQNRIDCMYCHSSSEYSKMATVPPVQLCMNCHILVAEGSNSGRYEIDKLKQAYMEKKPIEWVRVHNLPDHVYFNHAQHVGAGKLDCAECHGAVEQMEVLMQVEDMSMGWCLECHRSHEVDMKNAYYGDYKQLHEDIKSGKISWVTVEDIGGADCMKCHY